MRSGVRMSQNIRATPCSAGRHGSTANVLGSGIAIMSDSSIALKPVIEEPSKPIPPSNASASSVALIENAFRLPEDVGEPQADEADVALRGGRDHVLGGERAVVPSGAERYLSRRGTSGRRRGPVGAGAF